MADAAKKEVGPVSQLFRDAATAATGSGRTQRQLIKATVERCRQRDGRPGVSERVIYRWLTDYVLPKHLLQVWRLCAAWNIPLGDYYNAVAEQLRQESQRDG